MSLAAPFVKGGRHVTKASAGRFMAAEIVCVPISYACNTSAPGRASSSQAFTVIASML